MVNMVNSVNNIRMFQTESTYLLKANAGSHELEYKFHKANKSNMVTLLTRLSCIITEMITFSLIQLVCREGFIWKNHLVLLRSFTDLREKARDKT